MTETRSILSRLELLWLMERSDGIERGEPGIDEDPVKRAQARRFDQYEWERASGDGLNKPRTGVIDPGARAPEDAEL